MKPWNNVGRIGVGLEFGHGRARRQVGEAAIADRRIYLQFDAGLVASGVNPSPVRLRLDTSLQQDVDDLEGLPGLLHDPLPDGWARLVPFVVGPLEIDERRRLRQQAKTELLAETT